MRGMTAAHNKVRAQFKPRRGARLPDLEWSCELGKVAQTYANALARDGCSLEHSGSRYGENLYWSDGFDPTPAHVVRSWASESACYDSGATSSGGCTPMATVCRTCGHFTQIISRDTQRVGCGVASCGDEQVWVCNYDPPGDGLGLRRARSASLR
jgi:pathogenesis-related protein 1